MANGKLTIGASFEACVGRVLATLLTLFGVVPRATHAQDRPFPFFESCWKTNVWLDNPSHIPLHSVVVQDMNGDEVADLIYNRRPEGTAIRFGTGVNMFSEPMLLDPLGSESAVNVGNFNDDNLPDVAFVDFETSTTAAYLVVRPGDGKGTFGEPVTTPLSFRPFDFAIPECANWNRDEHTDVAIAGMILSGNGDGTFEHLADIPADMFYAEVADVDGDGDDDYFGKDEVGSARTYLLCVNEGNVGFVQKTLYTTNNSYSSFFTTGDFDGNSLIDFAVGRDGPGAEGYFYLNTGGSDFKLGGTLPLSEYSSYMFCVARPGGMHGIISFSRQPTVVKLMEFQSEEFVETWSRWTSFNGYDGKHVADMNGDGMADIYFENGGDVCVLLGSENGYYVAPEPLSVDVAQDSLLLGADSCADFNGDGSDDLVLKATGKLEVHLSNNADGFVKSFGQTIGATRRVLSTVPGDFDNDGLMDLVYATDQHNASRVIFGKGDGTFEAPTEEIAAIITMVADMNGDQMDDVLSEKGLGGLQVYLSQGRGTFSPPIPHEFGGLENDIELLDFDHDSDIDAVASLDTRIVVSLNDGTGTLVRSIFLGYVDNQRNLRAGDIMHSLAVADFNEDGFNDIACSIEWPSKLSLYLTNSSNDLSSPVVVGQMREPFRIEASDLDLDGHVDLVSDSHSHSESMVHFGHGNGTFEIPEVYIGPLGDGPIMGDFDRDSDLDIALGFPVQYDTVLMENRLLGPDIHPPQSSITLQSGNISQFSPAIPIPWNATDNQTGIHAVQLLYSHNGGPILAYGEFNQSPISFDTSTTGGDGEYEFHTIAIDGARNREDAPAEPDAIIQFARLQDATGWAVTGEATE